MTHLGFWTGFLLGPHKERGGAGAGRGNCQQGKNKFNFSKTWHGKLQVNLNWITLIVQNGPQGSKQPVIWKKPPPKYGEPPIFALAPMVNKKPPELMM